MYEVEVINLNNGSTEETAEFPFGDWQKIGWWLNDNELIDEKYKIVIRVREN